MKWRIINNLTLVAILILMCSIATQPVAAYAVKDEGYKATVTMSNWFDGYWVYLTAGTVADKIIDMSNGKLTDDDKSSVKTEVMAHAYLYLWGEDAIPYTCLPVGCIGGRSNPIDVEYSDRPWYWD